MMSEQIKETKAQRAERLKREKNAWDALEEIKGFARDGHASIPPEWLGTYFRFWGIYTQGDGVGAIGGAGGEGKATRHFMVRIRIPNGLLHAHQARVIADLSQRYGRGLLDITVRQNIQLHWVRIEDLPDLMERLWRSGLTTMGACGDDTRNITGCPLAGVDGEELFDASPIVRELDRFFVGNREFYNLPRKFKISVTGCRTWCSYPEINDIGLTGAIRAGKDGPEHGFSLRVGGGLSTEPHLARRLDAFVRWNQALPVVKGIAELFRGADVLRQSRDNARLKYLFLKHGWNEETFLSDLERRIGFKLDPAVDETVPASVFRDHVGVHPQKQPGYSYVGAAVLRGRMTAVQFRQAANLADLFANGELRLTTLQNLLVINVRQDRAEALAREFEDIQLLTAGSSFHRGAVACTGTEFCKLAITETKGFTKWLVEQLEDRLPEFAQQLRINVTGCPNSCGQHWIADLGLEGKKLKVNGKLEDAYYFCVGGAVGREAAIGRPVGYRCLASEVPDAIERLLHEFEVRRDPQEELRHFFGRHGNEEIRGFLAGAPVAAAARDLPQARVPHGVEG